MAYQNNWGNAERSVIHIRFEADATLDDMVASLDETARKLKSVEHTVHQIVDVSAMDHFPPGIIGKFTQIAMHEALSAKNNGVVVLVSSSRTMQTRVDIFSKIYHKLQVAPTPEAAYALLAEKYEVH